MLSTKLRVLAQQQTIGDREWMALHDLAQMFDRLFYGAVLSGYEMRCFRNDLAEAYADDEDKSIFVWPEAQLIPHCLQHYSYFMQQYDWGDSAVLAQYGEE